MSNLYSFFENKKEIINEASLAKLSSNLNSKDLASAGLPTNGLYIIFDTETTSLNLKKDDIITEIALVAYDSNLNQLDEYYHGAIKKYENLPDNKNPKNIINEVKAKLKPLFKDEKKLNKLVIGIFKDLRKTGYEARDEYKKIFKKRLSIFFQKNFPDKQEELANNSRVRDLFFELRKLISAAELKNVLSMTKFGKLTDPIEAKDEGELTMGSVEFINKMKEKYPDKVLIAVAHNYPFDYMMLKQAVGRKGDGLKRINQLDGLEYPFKKFIDTAQFTRKIANKLVLGVFIYYSRLYSITKDERYKKIALRIKPNDNNRMGTLASYFKVPNLSWHTAFNDVQATGQILKYLVALNSRVTSYFKDDNKNKGLIENIQTELEQFAGGEAEGSKKADFFDAMRGDIYRKLHEKLYAEFTGTEIVKKVSGKETKEENIEYLKMLEKEFPGLGDISSFLSKPKKSSNSSGASNKPPKPFSPGSQEAPDSMV